PSVTVNEIEAYDSVKAGKYTVTALPAYHAPKETPFVYIITDGEKTLLYLHDTGIPFDEVFDYLEKNKIRADLISYDCTYVALPSAGGHMGLDSVPLVKQRLESIGVCDKKTVNVVNHFSHNGMLLHDELCEAAEKLGFLVSYDGMTIEF
ncbi:MAG: PhnP protein, partial [Clostridia bacterium]|nr:PhnP protein [Clostridia bacterium]